MEKPAVPEIRKGQGQPVPVSRLEFELRFRERFYDPNFDAERDSIDRLLEIAWKNHCEARKAATSLANTVQMIRSGRREPDAELDELRPK
jgi:hypothetical protein